MEHFYVADKEELKDTLPGLDEWARSLVGTICESHLVFNAYLFMAQHKALVGKQLLLECRERSPSVRHWDLVFKNVHTSSSGGKRIAIMAADDFELTLAASGAGYLSPPSNF